MRWQSARQLHGARVRREAPVGLDWEEREGQTSRVASPFDEGPDSLLRPPLQSAVAPTPDEPTVEPRATSPNTERATAVATPRIAPDAAMPPTVARTPLRGHAPAARGAFGCRDGHASRGARRNRRCARGSGGERGTDAVRRTIRARAASCEAADRPAVDPALGLGRGRNGRRIQRLGPR
ncbi:MAG: hypothetical protein NZ898_11170 [Myxococcota bacterium]|nr:hypothetical protein [Myxococcota bacterium]MDW8362276.1 hypothetical protein [Myxococcales bacterium]